MKSENIYFKIQYKMNYLKGLLVNDPYTYIDS